MEDIATYVEGLATAAKAASRPLGFASNDQRVAAVRAMATALRDAEPTILEQNGLDMDAAAKAGTSAGLLDRLKLTHERIEGMAAGLEKLAELPDPVGRVLEHRTIDCGLDLQKVSVPLGLVAMVYEARPNVTADAFGLCFKTGNVVILKGGSDAIHSNMAITKVLRKAIAAGGGCEDAILLVEDTSRETAKAMMRLNQYIDVLIPRGGAGLIRTVVENSTVPVIETGTGNCHVYVDASADIDMAVKIILNAKTQRTGVCNACESLVIHKDIIEEALPAIAKALRERHCELRGDEAALEVVPDMKKATEEDWGTEYLDLIASVRTVASVDEAIEHINRYNTGHSEAIVTKDYANARKFLEEVDAAAVYVNASTRFTDGFEFGFGAEIGISTQKLHARGPMGLKELTTTKYVIYGDGQIRE